MAAQHMPGPWQVGYRGTTVMGASPNAKICDIRGYGYLTGTGDGALGLTGEEAVAIQHANAALIAAAPDMLAMARELAEPFADISSDFLAEVSDATPGDLHLIGGRGLTAHFARAILAARAAIAKAEGR